MSAVRRSVVAKSRRHRLLAVVLALLVGISGSLALTAGPAQADDSAAATDLGTWGIRQSYRNYINGPIAHGTTTASEGAVWLDGTGNAKGPFTWPVSAASFDPATGTGEVRFTGTVYTGGHDYGQGYILEAEWSDLHLAIDGAVGTLSADLEFRPFAGANPSIPPPAVQTAQDVAFATMDLSGVSWPVGPGGDLTIVNAPTTGIAAAMELIGWDQFYSGEMPNVGLDAFSLSTTVDEEPELIEVTGAQLRWAYSRYAQYGVFGPWSQVADGANVSVTQADGQSISGNADDAGRPFNLGLFDDGSGTVDPVTGAGTITWDTGDWVLNAYNGLYGAPDETLRDPQLTVGDDGSGTLSFEAYIPAALDMAGNPVPAVGPERVTVATFSSLDELTGTSIDIVPDFAGRPYYWPAGSGQQYNEDCDGIGGSWPQEWIDFAPPSVQLHYYTTSCSGLNLMKPPLPFTVDWAPTPIGIVTQPTVPAAVPAGDRLDLVVVAAGNPTPTFQWQRSADGTTWVDVADADQSRYTFHPGVADDGAAYRVELTGGGDTIVSDAVVLDVESSPAVIVTPPADQTVGDGSVATFSVAVSGKPDPTVTWQRSDDDGVTWVDQPAQTNASYFQITVDQVADDDAWFRVVADNGLGEPATSAAATLTVTTAPPAFTDPSMPRDHTVGEGGVGWFEVSLTGAPAPTVQWERSDDGGATWSPIAGATETGYRIDAVAQSDQGAQFRAVAVNPHGGPITSRAATLTVTTAPPSFLRHPADSAVLAGVDVTFSIWTTGSPAAAVTWERSGDDGVTWTEIPGAGGIDNRSYAFTVAESDDGARFRAVATNPYGTVTSDVAHLSVGAKAPTFTRQPVNTTGLEDGTVEVQSVATGLPAPTYQWQSSSDDGATWTDWPEATSSDLVITLASHHDGLLVRSVASNDAGTVPSDVARLSVLSVTPTIDVQPTDVSAFAGSTATVTATVTAAPAATFQWQSSTDGGTTWSDWTGEGGTEASLAIPNVDAGLDGTSFRVVATNRLGSATSDGAELHVVAPTGGRQLLFNPATVVADTPTTVTINGAGYLPTVGDTGGIWLVLAPTSAWESGDVNTVDGAAIVWTSVSMSALRAGDGFFAESLDLPELDADTSYSIGTYNQNFADRTWDAFSPVPVEEPPVPVWEPQVTVSRTTGLDRGGEVVTITGSGFDPAANVGTRPPLKDQKTGVYVVFGRFGDPWRPSVEAPSSARSVIAQLWVLPAASRALVDPTGTDARYATLAEDGTFEVSLELTMDETLSGTYGVATYAAGGAVNASQELLTPVTFADPPPPEPFVDVPEDDIFYADVMWAVSQGITEGYEDGTFGPTRSTTRQTAAAFLYRLAGSPAVEPDAPVFFDVPADSGFRDAISWLASEGITTGYTDGGFRPTEVVSRQAMAAFLYRSAGSPAVEPDAPAFSDVPAEGLFHDAISWLASEGITEGYDDGTFRPTDVVSRQAMVAFLHRYASL